jgi:hypothetical protein
MITPEEQGHELPYIDVIVQQKLGTVADTSSIPADYKLSLTIEEWTRSVKTDQNQAARKAAIVRLRAAIPQIGGYALGEPRDIENILQLVPNKTVEDSLAYFVEVSIADINNLLKRLAEAKRSLAFEASQQPPDEFWTQDAQRRMDENTKILSDAIARYAKYKWLYEHTDDQIIQQKVEKAFQESVDAPRSYLK